MVAWSTTDKSANVVLSGGNLTAALNTAAAGGVRCDTSFTGLRYFEVLVVNGSNIRIGWADATASLTTTLGQDTHGVRADPPSQNVVCNNVVLGAMSTFGANAGSTVCIAADFTAKLIWTRVNGGLWNNSLTADPATGTGGFSIAALAAGPYFPMFQSVSNGASVTARFGAADMWFATPAGFSTLDTNVQAFEAVGKLISGAILAPPKNAVSLQKLISGAILAPPRNAISLQKMVGYAILRPRNDNFTRANRLEYLRM
jgi:hypothetical protein